MSFTSYKDIIIDTLKSITLLGTNSDGKIIESTHSLNADDVLLTEASDSLLTENSYVVMI